MTRFDIGQRCRLLLGAGFRFGVRSARCKLLLGRLLLGQKRGMQSWVSAATRFGFAVI